MSMKLRDAQLLGLDAMRLAFPGGFAILCRGCSTFYATDAEVEACAKTHPSQAMPSMLDYAEGLSEEAKHVYLAELREMFDPSLPVPDYD